MRAAAMPSQLRTAALLICGATLCFASLDTVTKYLSQRYPVPLLVWARWSVQALAILIWLGPQVGKGLVRTRNLTSQLFRGAILIGSSLCFTGALKELPLAEATALNYSTPVLVTILAVVFLDERMTRMRVAFVIAGFVGMLLIVRPGTDLFQSGALLALGAAWFYGMFQIVTRKLADEDWRTLLFYPALCGSVMMSAFVPFIDWPQTIRPIDALMILVGGVVGTFGHFLFLLAFQRASASAVTPFTYMQLVWATLIGWIVFGMFPDAGTLLGMAVITGSGALITLHEQRKARLAGVATTVQQPAAME
jgi:drug/metabolite transporter (DMT)-like permease